MPFEVKTSLLDNVDGSAELIIGNNKIITSVSGPIEAKPRQELPTSSSLEIVIRPAVGISSTREKLIEDKLRSLLQSVIIGHKFPRQLIQIVVQFLITDTNEAYTSTELNAAINCCYFALIDAQIPMYSSFASTTISINDKKMIENPSIEQLKDSESHHVICFIIENGETDRLLLLESQGKFTEDQLFEAIEQGSKACQLIHQDYQRKYIKQKLEDDYIWRTQ